MGNRLKFEDSPYLQQHKDNPVDWFPWGKDAFEKAKNEKKPIFVSIGYSSCHWCHVMERESFENIEIAKLLNENFISIKIDREDRPDLDKHYQTLYNIIYRKGGGWPLSVFLTHEKKPFHIDTYIPPKDNYGKMGITKLISVIKGKYTTQFDKLNLSANKLDEMSKTITPKHEKFIEDSDFIKLFVDGKKRSFDNRFGGFSEAPKFPHTSSLKALSIFGESEVVDTTLRNMAKGGLYDLIDGGFCRYSVDEKWLVPHFEKMTYDNALLLEVYANRFLQTGEKLFKRIAIETAEFLINKMSQDNLFFSASDADTDGEEGKYFTYSFDEVKDKFSEIALKELSLTPYGNFEGKSIVRVESLTNFSDEFKILREIRKDRKYPFVDKKIILSWNSMVIKSLLRLSLIEPKYLDIAIKSLDSLLENLYLDGEFYHSKLFQKDAKILAFLEDYAYFSDMLVEIYQRTLNKKYLDLLEKVLDMAINKFSKDLRWFISENGDFQTEAEIEDSSYPSSVAIIFQSLLSASTLKDHFVFLDIVENCLEQGYYSTYLKYPTAFATLTDVMYRYKKQVMVIKSTKENLEKLKIDSSLFLKKVDSCTNYQICGIANCIASFDNPDEVENFVLNR